MRTTSASSLTFQLPVPAQALRPNVRKHWAVGAEAKANAFIMAKKEAERVLDGAKPPEWRKAGYTVKLFKLKNQFPDEDNFIASLKAYLDGLQAAGIVYNDRGLWHRGTCYEKVERMARVEITVSPE